MALFLHINLKEQRYYEKKPVTDFVSNSEETHHKVNTNETKQFLNNFPFKFPEVMRLWRCGNQLC